MFLEPFLFSPAIAAKKDWSHIFFPAEKKNSLGRPSAAKGTRSPSRNPSCDTDRRSWNSELNHRDAGDKVGIFTQIQLKVEAFSVLGFFCQTSKMFFFWFSPGSLVGNDREKDCPGARWEELRTLPVIRSICLSHKPVWTTLVTGGFQNCTSRTE